MNYWERRTSIFSHTILSGCWPCQQSGMILPKASWEKQQSRSVEHNTICLQNKGNILNHNNKCKFIQRWNLLLRKLLLFAIIYRFICKCLKWTHPSLILTLQFTGVVIENWLNSEQCSSRSDCTDMQGWSRYVLVAKANNLLQAGKRFSDFIDFIWNCIFLINYCYTFFLSSCRNI